MQDFKELVKIVTKYRINKIDMLSFENGTDNKFLKVFKGISDGSINSDAEAAEKINVKERSIYYRTFKSRLKAKLLNNLLFIEFGSNELTNYTKALHYCSRNQHAIRILSRLSATRSSIRIAEKTLHKAIQYELAEFVVYCARILSRQYSYSGDQEKFEFYNTLHARFSAIYMAEYYIETDYLSISVQYGKTNLFDPTDIDFLKKKEAKALIFKSKYDTYKVNLNYYRIKATYEFCSESYLDSLATWQVFDEFLDRYKDFEYGSRIAESALQKMNCYLHIHDFESCQTSALICEKYFPPFSNNWFVYKEILMLLSIRTRQYEAAGQTINEIIPNNRFSNLPANQKEKWRILEAYFYLIHKAGKTNIQFPKSLKKFRLSTFINETPIYSKDKKGLNIAILIVQVVSRIIEHEYMELSEKIQALKKYSLRYSEKEPAFSSQVFLQMIFLADKFNFDLKKTEKAVNANLEILMSRQFKYVSTLEGLEIVPYLHLWDIVRDHLR
jgi:hypothetical protein